MCALWKHCLLANASIFLGVRHVTGLLLCNLATLQCCSCSTTKRYRLSPFQRRAQNVNHSRHRCDFEKRLYLIDMTRCGNINDDSCSRIVTKQCCGQLMLPGHLRAVVFERFHSPDFARPPFGNIVFSPMQVCSRSRIGASQAKSLNEISIQK